MIIIHHVNTPVDRLATARVQAALRSAPVVVVSGARQTGKSTLVRQLGRRTYLTLDDPAVRDDAASEPDALLNRAPRLTLDEVQRHPDLLLAIKRAVDLRRTAGRFLLTGSANLLMMKRVADSLAGRAVYLTLWPMTRREQLGLGTAGRWADLFAASPADWPSVLNRARIASEDWRGLIRRGGYPVPALHLQDAESRASWFSGYIATYLERDVLDLSAVHRVVELRRLMRAVCLRLGGIVNQTDLGRDVGLPQPTVHRYLGLLETSYQLVHVPAYAVNRTKRLIKAPKVYWSDPGLALHLSGEDEPRGAHLENLILADLLAWAGAQAERPEVMYWRTAAGEEVDFVVERKGKLLAIEVKAATRVSGADARGLRSFREEYGAACHGGLLLYAGPEVQRLAEGVMAAPWWMVV